MDRKIPFIISDEFSAQNKALIEKAIYGFQNTCIQFEPKKAQDIDYIVIKGGEGCNSPVGRQGGSQNVILGEGCLRYDTIIHELMHSIGFFHEHQRYDRNNYIVIHRENIKTGTKVVQFRQKVAWSLDSDFETRRHAIRIRYKTKDRNRGHRPRVRLQ